MSMRIRPICKTCIHRLQTNVLFYINATRITKQLRTHVDFRIRFYRVRVISLVEFYGLLFLDEPV
jgi:hypothetical protein